MIKVKEKRTKNIPDLENTTRSHCTLAVPTLLIAPQRASLIAPQRALELLCGSEFCRLRKYISCTYVYCLPLIRPGTEFSLMGRETIRRRSPIQL